MDAVTIRRITQLVVHTRATDVPRLAKDEYDALKADIRERGITTALEILADGTVVDGHHRLRIAQELGLPDVPVLVVNPPDPYIFMVKAALLRRHLTEAQRAMLALKLDDYQQAKADVRIGRPPNDEAETRLNSAAFPRPRDVAAAAAGVGHDSIQKAIYVTRTAPDLAEKLADGTMSLNAAKKEARQRVVTAERAAAYDAGAVALAEGRAELTLYHGDLLEAGAAIGDGTVDAIITDPPYGDTWLDAYVALGTLGKRVLKPGGSLIALVGQAGLPDVLTALCASLEYRWTLAYLIHGSESPIWSRGLNNFWKPVLWLSNGMPEGREPSHASDLIQSDKADKAHHVWGQSEGGFAQLVERFTAVGDLVLDPFLGGGTTAVVALRLGRRCIGIDVDQSALDITRQRVSEVLRNGQQ